MDSSKWEDKAARYQARMERRAARWEQRGQHHHSPASGLVGAAIIIAVGAIFLLNNLGILRIHDFWMYWPVILIVLGVAHLAQNRLPGGIVMLAVGSIFLANNLGVFRFDWGTYWPLVIILAGVAMLAGTMQGPAAVFGPPRPNPVPPMPGAGPQASPPSCGFGASTYNGSSTTADQNVNAWVMFGGCKRKIVSDDFRSATLYSAFGGIEIDLRRAKTTQPEVYIQANATFGGIEIRIPDEWIADVRGAGIMGGYEDKTVRPPAVRPGEPAPPRVVVTGAAIFGGVSIEN